MGNGNLSAAMTLSAEGALTEEQIDIVLAALPGAVEKVTARHPEPPEQRALLFWEVFEVMMEGCRELQAQVSLPLHEGIQAWVQTMLAFIGLCDREEVELPEPPQLDGDFSQEQEAPEL